MESIRNWQHSESFHQPCNVTLTFIFLARKAFGRMSRNRGSSYMELSRARVADIYFAEVENHGIEPYDVKKTGLANVPEFLRRQ